MGGRSRWSETEEGGSKVDEAKGGKRDDLLLLALAKGFLLLPGDLRGSPLSTRLTDEAFGSSEGFGGLKREAKERKAVSVDATENRILLLKAD